jgi:hypothetical protein
MSPIGYARTAGVLFAAEAVFPIVHRLTGSEYLGFTHLHNVVIDTGLAVVWITAAVVAFVRRPSNGPAFLLAGASVSLMHEIMFSVATCDSGPIGAGIPFLVVGGVQLYLIAHTFPAFAERAERHEAAEPQEVEAPTGWRLGRLWLRPKHSH